MTKIKMYIDRIDEELEDAKYYAEAFVECKAKKNMTRANSYHSISEQELQHANIIHDIAIEEIDELEDVFMPTEDMRKMWMDSHARYVERAAWIRKMLDM